MSISENKINDEYLKNIAGGEDSPAEKKCPLVVHAWEYTGEKRSDKERRIRCMVCGTLGWRRRNPITGEDYNAWDE